MLHVSALVHVTLRGNLLSIMRSGLRLGVDRIAGIDAGGRPHAYFAAYLPEDPRYATGSCAFSSTKSSGFGANVARQ